MRRILLLLHIFPANGPFLLIRAETNFISVAPVGSKGRGGHPTTGLAVMFLPGMMDNDCGGYSKGRRGEALQCVQDSVE